MVATRESFPLLAELLDEQQQLDTPVARFAVAFEAATPLPGPQLIPLSQPGTGEQYAFEVDLDRCTGCKSCVAACHSLNGLDETETWRDVGLVVSPNAARPFSQTVTSACHHCADPACLNGCPVLAYEKDPITGIVRHLDDQCIGCSYCVLKCPYDVPKFSPRLGIVRKCDMCHGRLAAGEAPACAQACPTQAIRIVVVPVDPVRRIADTTQFLPSAPAPSYTQPTTRYVTKRALPRDLVAGDAAALRPQLPHWPLVVMLTLVPAALGAAAAGESLGAWATGAVGLAASAFHLGQPRRAWRIFLGWRRSWLSREAMILGAWFGLASAALVIPALRPVSLGIGLAGLYCSVMIYVDTHRHFWRAASTLPRFFGTTVVVAAALLAPAVAVGLLFAKIAWESVSLWGDSIPARLQRGPLRFAVALRLALGFVAALLLLWLPGWPAVVVLIAGEMAERTLFFRAVDAPKMPGSPA